MSSSVTVLIAFSSRGCDTVLRGSPCATPTHQHYTVICRLHVCIRCSFVCASTGCAVGCWLYTALKVACGLCPLVEERSLASLNPFVYLLSSPCIAAARDLGRGHAVEVRCVDIAAAHCAVWAGSVCLSRNLPWKVLWISPS